jgi:hypothetical protein
MNPESTATRLKVWLPLVASILLPRVAQACAVCFSGRSDETRQAFVGSTAFMTFLPILVIGGVVWWLRRRALAMQAEQRASAARHLVRVD